MAIPPGCERRIAPRVLLFGSSSPMTGLLGLTAAHLALLCCARVPTIEASVTTKSPWCKCRVASTDLLCLLIPASALQSAFLFSFQPCNQVLEPWLKTCRPKWTLESGSCHSFCCLWQPPSVKKRKNSIVVILLSRKLTILNEEKENHKIREMVRTS